MGRVYDGLWNHACELTALQQLSTLAAAAGDFVSVVLIVRTVAVLQSVSRLALVREVFAQPKSQAPVRLGVWDRACVRNPSPGT